MASSIITRPAFNEVYSSHQGIQKGLHETLAHEDFQKTSYEYEFNTESARDAVCTVTRIIATDAVYMILTDPENKIGLRVSRNFADIASALKSIDPVLAVMEPNNIHWIEYRGPGSYNGRSSPIFLLVIMHFNEFTRRFERASWGHIFKLADIVVGRGHKMIGGAPCKH